MMLDINADMGESFGRWTLGDDAAVIRQVTSANVACGFHAGDPHIMRRIVQLAVAHGVALGAHVAFPDLVGFGRRRIDVTPQELKDLLAYQVGALMGLAKAAGARVEHVKPHSAFYRLCMLDDAYARAVAEAIAEIDADMILLMSGERVARAAREVGIPYMEEALVDLEHDASGSYIPEWPKRMWDPERVATRAVMVATERRLPLRDGGFLTTNAGSVCLHGDADNAAAIAQVVRQRLAEAGVDVVPLRKVIMAYA
jgi:5-oxoprolinase (ATP-hydrolysing) subunit A